jgi:hypothetical protein
MINEYSIRTTRARGGMFFAVATDLQRERHDADVDAWAATRNAARQAVKREMDRRGFVFVPYRDF